MIFLLKFFFYPLNFICESYIYYSVNPGTKFFNNASPGNLFLSIKLREHEKHC